MQRKIGPYRVEERLGAGGMGEVYKAYDSRLDRWVAIKRIRGDRDEAAENRERFQREARATARLNHSSIVHLYDIFQDGESDCIVMEYVEGMTLDKLIRNGPLDPLQVANLGHEIATGLSEAHAKGIIHRDLKVENVIVTPKGHAKILDFGLARPLLKNELDTSLTGKGQLVGTSRTMSPEYVSGEEIDHRSDLFSLGVLLYEAVTSHSPFKAHNTLATLKQVMLHRQTPAHLVNSHVPEELSMVIELLLEKDPADRPQSADEVALEFGQIAGQLSSGNLDRPPISSSFTTTPTEVFTPTATAVDLWVRRRGLMSILALLVICGMLAFFLARRWMIEPDPILTPEGSEALALNARGRVVLADFQNRTGESILDDSLELAFRLGLERSRVLLPRTQMQGALSRMKLDSNTKVDRQLGLEICQREGAKALVIGSIVKIGETYSLSAEIIDPQSGINTFSTQESARDQNAIFDALDVVTKDIRLHIGESLVAIERNQQPLERVTTGNLEALKAYSVGLMKIFEGQEEAAVQLLKRAIEIDPEFAMAHAKLASVYIYLDFDRAKTLEHLDLAQRFSERLTEFEKLYVDGWVARLHNNPEDVIQTWSLMSSLYPEEFAGQFNLGLARLIYLSQYQGAASALEAAVRVAPPENLAQALIHLGYCQIALGKFDDARASLEEARANQEEPASQATNLPAAALHVAMESYPEARRLLEETLSNPQRFLQFAARLSLVACDAGEGKFKEALRQTREALHLATEDGMESSSLTSQLSAAVIQEQIGPASNFRTALAMATQVAASQVHSSQEANTQSPVTLPMVAIIGKLNARSKDIAGAENMQSLIPLLRGEASPAGWQSYSKMLEGEILAAKGDSLGAVERLEDAVELADLFQAHESLARAYETAAQPEAAIAEYEWLLDHRGQGLFECLSLCNGLSVIDWSLAFYNLGRLHEQLENLPKAVENYRKFIELWQEDGTELMAWQDAVARLEQIHAELTAN